MFDDFEQYLNKDEKDIDVVDYIENFNPELVADFNGLTSFLFSSRPQKVIGDFILSANKTIVDLDKNRKHEKGSNINAYEVYESYANPKYKLNKDEFKKYFKYIKDIYLDSNELSCDKKIVNSISNLRNEGVSDETIKNFYVKVCNLQNVSIKNIWPNIDEFDNETATRRNMIYNSFLKSINVDIFNVLEFYSYFYLDEKSNDITLEIRVILPKIINLANSINDDGTIILFCPSVYFIKKLYYSRYPFKNKNVSVVISDEILSTLLNSKIPITSNYRFYHIGEIDELINKTNAGPSLSVVFANNIQNIASIQNTLNSIFGFVTKQHHYMLLIGESILFSKDHLILDCLKETNVYGTDLFPSGIVNSTYPKRKLLIYGNYGYINNSEFIKVKEYSIPKKINNILYGKTFNICIDKLQFFNNDFSLRKEFFDKYRENNAKTKNNRQAAKKLSFSANIKLEYTLSGEGTKEKPYRYEVFPLYPESNKRIEHLSGSTKLYEGDSFEKWVNEVFMFSTSKTDKKTYNRRKEIATIYSKHFANRALTIKDIYYIHPELDDYLPSYSIGLLNDLFKTFIAEITVNLINVETLMSFMELNVCSDKYNDRQLLNVLAVIFDTAVINGNCKHNPARELISNEKDNKWGLNSIRSSLTQKFFYLNQIKEIDNYAFNLINAKKDIGLGIAMLLRLYLGLEANYISALLWKDIHFDDVPYLELNRQSINDGTKFVELDSSYQHIKLPLIERLRAALSDERDRQLNVVANNNLDYLDKCTVVFGKDCIIDDQIFVYSPFNINVKVRKFIKRIKLDEDIIAVPDNKKGTVETNLNYYPGDCFKFNYWHYLVKEHPNITSGQLFYLLGYKIPEDTISNHYVGYGDEQSISKLLDLQPKYLKEEKDDI